MAPRTRKQQKPEPKPKGERKTTPTFFLELPLVVTEGQAKRLGGHLEAAREFYNAVLSRGLDCLHQMRSDPAWQAARAIPRTHKEARAAAFSAVRKQYGFSDYAFFAWSKDLRVSW